jgi:hypothetical protein
VDLPVTLPGADRRGAATARAVAVVGGPTDTAREGETYVVG